MSIDFSQTITAEDKAARIATDRAVRIKAVCKKRILTRFNAQAQANITQAMAVYTAEIMRGSDRKAAERVSGLQEGDFALISAGRQWIAAMQATSRTMRAHPRRTVDWPDLPAGVADLVARF